MKEVICARINLKTSAKNRQELIDFCLNKDDPHDCKLAIGWSCVLEDPFCEEESVSSFEEFYKIAKEWFRQSEKRLNPVFNLFNNVKIDDLFWTRDLDGMYWICRVKARPVMYHDSNLDISAYLPVEAYYVHDEVPGKLKIAFNRPNAGVCQRIHDEKIIPYSKFQFNRCSKRAHYFLDISNIQQDIISNLPDLSLEELVLTYIQVEHNYYLASGSLAARSTTPKIECYFYQRSEDSDEPKRAVVQVKSGSAELDASAFEEYINQGDKVFLYASKVKNSEKYPLVEAISKESLRRFYYSHKDLLPRSITDWENIFS